jgi:hypothetical protein
MKSAYVEAKLASIEAQIKILKASRESRVNSSKNKGLRSLKGILKRKGKFDIKEIDSLKIKFPEEL